MEQIMDMDDLASPFAFPAWPYSEDEADPEDVKKLCESTFRGDWEKVVELYETKAEVQKSVITSSNDSALHMAISDDREDDVPRMVASIAKNGNTEALTMRNNRGETPLHRAATRKSVTMCECIVEAGQAMRLDLLGITNKWGETPIFTAVLHNCKAAFVFLHRAATAAYPENPEKPYEFLRRADKSSEDNVLQSAIRREHFDLAFHIIKMYPELVGRSNAKGMTPLHVLASKPSAFRSGRRGLSWWNQIIYLSVQVDPLKYDPEESASNTTAEQKCPAPENYRTCYQFLWGSYSVLGKIPATSSVGEGGDKSQQIRKKKEGDPEAPHNSYHINKNIPQNYTTCYEALVSGCLNLLRFIGFENKVEKIRKEKEKHEWSVQILKALMEKQEAAYITGGRDPGGVKITDPRLQTPSPAKNDQDQKGNGGDTDNKKSTNEAAAESYTPLLVATKRGVIEGMNEILSKLPVSIYDSDKKCEEPETCTPLLVAAQRGVIEVVNEILSQLPVSIYDTTSKDKNILQVAVEYRQPGVVEAVHKQVEKELKLNLWDDLVQSVDSDENTILHLAAHYEESMVHPSQIHGTAMLMQWEIKWYEYVKSLSPHHFLTLGNTKNETPEQIFTRGHEKLVKDSSDWLKDTSESCSVVAALVAGVSFATSSTVPGGTNDDTGKPTLEQQPAFELFAITSLIGLCFSVTALIMFLSILTSRKLPRDFKRNLPSKILLGLSSLFVSIASMLISFCAAHFFVLEDRFKTAVFPLYAATCLPVSFYAIVQFPLYMDLLNSIITPVPQSLPSGHV